MLAVSACMAPLPSRRSKIRIKDVERAIRQAHSVCYKNEHKPACRIAWDKVEELSSELARQREEELYERALHEMCQEDPDACKDYEV